MSENCKACPLLQANATERDRLRKLLRDLYACYESQIEQRYCICGSNDEGSHSYACVTQMRVQDSVQAALASETGEPKP
jgi:hypothetical protein